MAGDPIFVDEDLTSITKKSQLKIDVVRRFTMRALDKCDMLCVSVTDLLKMKMEFPKCFSEIFHKCKDRLRYDLTLKFEVIRYAEY